MQQGPARSNGQARPTGEGLAAMAARENAQGDGRAWKTTGLLSSSTPRPLRVDIKRRAVIRLRATRHGKKLAVAQRLASECGRSVRAVFYWQRQYLARGFGGLSSTRSDRGISRIFSGSDLESLRRAAARVRRYGDLSVEWRALGLPGSPETFRLWIRRFQECPSESGEQEKISA
jgi:hypothetical protein